MNGQVQEEDNFNAATHSLITPLTGVPVPPASPRRSTISSCGSARHAIGSHFVPDVDIGSDDASTAASLATPGRDPWGHQQGQLQLDRSSSMRSQMSKSGMWRPDASVSFGSFVQACAA